MSDSTIIYGLTNCLNCNIYEVLKAAQDCPQCLSSNNRRTLWAVSLPLGQEHSREDVLLQVCRTLALMAWKCPSHRQSYARTRYYIAPEILGVEKADDLLKSVDIWDLCVGEVVLEGTSEHPYVSQKIQTYIDSLIKAEEFELLRNLLSLLSPHHNQELVQLAFTLTEPYKDLIDSWELKKGLSSGEIDPKSLYAPTEHLSPTSQSH